jgi:hypothetical protein
MPSTRRRGWSNCWTPSGGCCCGIPFGPHGQPRRLGVEQLIKHVLGLRSQHPREVVQIVYVYWEPANAGEHRWVAEHRKEVQQLQEYVGGSEIRFYALTYWELLDEWEDLTGPPPWLAEHLGAVRARYEVDVPALI